MCEQTTAIMIANAAYGALQSNLQANAMERSADAAYRADKRALKDQAEQRGNEQRANLLKNSVAFLKRSGTATAAGAEAGVSPLATINNEIIQASLAEGNIDYNYEIGAQETARGYESASARRQSRLSQADAIRPGLLDTGLSLASAYYGGKADAATRTAQTGGSTSPVVWKPDADLALKVQT